MGLRSVSSAISGCSSISIIDINGNIIIFLSSEPSLCGVKQLISFEHEDCESNH